MLYVVLGSAATYLSSFSYMMHVHTYIKAPTCFGVVTSSSGSALFELARVTVVKIIS